ncbi:uncharacterized protein LOC133852273 [Alnus glutinosa]|uniref:uncharacterized protein LOC133852273 n=1 Tax=Alnus glutinosa TaxID=3517 RepID=UPI002D78D5A0|nr:uncharacterized protein LOC133852273 [Alnus glutinosa]
MAGERKKRKMESEEGQEEDEDDERKMEMFFALIRSTRDVRDRLKEKSSSEDHVKKVEKDHLKAIWNPTFRPEDFMQQDHDKSKMMSPPGREPQPGPSKPEKEEEEEDDHKEVGGNPGNGIDLNLSL